MNHYAVDNGDIEVYSYEYIPDTDKTPIKSEENYEMEHIF